MKHTLFLLLPVALLAAGPATAADDKPPAALSAPERTVDVENTARGFEFSFDGALLQQTDWEDAANPVKFVYEAVLLRKDGKVAVHFWSTPSSQRDWWLETVAAYLFEPENSVSVDITRQGYDVITIGMPGGGGVPASVDALVFTPAGVFRLTCTGCASSDSVSPMEGILDSLYAPGL
jgi:hypothetical protein